MILLVTITVLYGVFSLVGAYHIWFSKSNSSPVSISDSVSVIVALRNEEKNINRLVKGLINQKYPFPLEFVFVDDNSSDKTLISLNKWAAKDKRIIVLSNEYAGKKSCISKALKFVSNSIVIQTDADCEVGPYWILSSVKKMLSSDYDMVLGPVYPFKYKTVFNGLIRLDWLAMQFLTIFTAKLKNPGLANGANLLFYRIDYEDFNASKYGQEYASGDDMFFLRFLQKKGKNIGFNLDQMAIVKTEMPVSLADLIKQRLRWSSKSGRTTNMMTYLCAGIICLANFCWIGACFSTLENGHKVFVLIVCLIFKLVIDYFICWTLAGFYRDFKVLCLVPVMFFIYPIYLFTGILFSFKGVYRWKDRTVK